MIPCVRKQSTKALVFSVLRRELEIKKKISISLERFLTPPRFGHELRETLVRIQRRPNICSMGKGKQAITNNMNF